MLHGGEIYGKKIEYDFSVNLNPYPCPDKVREALTRAVSDVGQYPDMSQTLFREAIASSKGDNISADNVIGGNGASELISAVVRLIAPKKVLLPVPSFYGYRHALNMIPNCKIEEHLLDSRDGFELTETFLQKITDKTDLIILANPNNPTGKCISDDILSKILYRCKETKTAIILDECFFDLSSGRASGEKYVGIIPDLFVINAYTKLFAIPGVRIGYAISGKKEIEALKKFLPEWNMSIFSQKAGCACADIVQNSDYVSKSLDYIRAQREELIKSLSGFTVYDSDTNYILMQTDKDIFDRLLENGILIRDCSNFIGLKKGFYRIAVKDSKALKTLTDVLNFL
ncbi:MAG: aminotransferase class I/II-fold pyridoxal phosphate-dependent enzyme [Butyrivibrio sp.]|nr:aminotransferase class I/II-fold pyridoxal phosphate-dependent enzyme [Butyrivibrio sp.]